MLKFLRNSLYFLFVFFTLVSCTPHAFILKVDTGIIVLDTLNRIKEDTSALRIINPYKNQMESKMNEVLAYSGLAMSRDLPEGLLNDFVADLILKKSNEYYKNI